MRVFGGPASRQVACFTVSLLPSPLTSTATLRVVAAVFTIWQVVR